MNDTAPAGSSVSKLKSTPGIPWIAGLVVATVLSLILSLVVVAVTNEWALLVLVMVIGLIISFAVGFAVRLTSVGVGGFLPAFVTAGLGVHVLTHLAGAGFDEFGYALWSTFQSAPFSAFVFFYGVVAGIVATVGRRS